jgi:hypothetical protein
LEKKRPIGVSALGIIFILTGGFCALISAFSAISELITQGPISLGLITFSGVLSLIIVAGYSFIPLVVGIGLFSLKPWARKATLFVIPPLIIFAFFFLGCYYCRPLSEQRRLSELVLSNKKFFIYNFLIAIVIISPILIYFTRPKVKRAFSERNP